MNKQEAIEKIEKILLLPTDDVDPSFDLGYNNGLRKAKSIIEKIEPEKPVIPQFVAEWIEKSKAEKRNLRNALNNGGEKMRLWFLGQENYDIFARAWLDGYEVEKEPIYVIRSKGTTNKYGAQQRLCHSSEKGNYFWCGEFSKFKHKFTREELEQAGFGWVFDCEGVEARKVK